MTEVELLCLLAVDPGLVPVIRAAKPWSLTSPSGSPLNVLKLRPRTLLSQFDTRKFSNKQ